MRKLRKAVDAGLPILGTVIVFLAVLLLSDQQLTLRVVIVMFGVLMIDAGIWKLTHPLLPNERRFQGLRLEVDEFIKIVRRLNADALEARQSPAAQDNLRRTVTEMHNAVDRMEKLAGKTAEELSRASVPL
ncbi:MAG: hypothetical protein WEE89_01980 [Gemmatimonadota bacterium]